MASSLRINEKKRFGDFQRRIRKVRLTPCQSPKTVRIYCDASMACEEQIAGIAVITHIAKENWRIKSGIRKTGRFGELYAILEALKEAAKYKDVPVVILNDSNPAIESIKKRMFYGYYPEGKRYPEHRKEIMDEIIELIKQNKNVWIRRKKRNSNKAMREADKISRALMRKEKRKREKNEQKPSPRRNLAR